MSRIGMAIKSAISRWGSYRPRSRGSPLVSNPQSAEELQIVSLTARSRCAEDLAGKINAQAAHAVHLDDLLQLSREIRWFQRPGLAP